MKIYLTIPNAGAGRWCWTGWKNAFEALGHQVTADLKETDLLICSTSCPSENILEFRKYNPEAKIALNVLAYTDENWPGINNDGVQASPGNIEYAKQLKPDIVFAQYSPVYRDSLLKNWAKEGFKLGSMEMAIDSTLYKHNSSIIRHDYAITYTGGRWAYKAQNLDRYVTPLLQKYWQKSFILGNGWNFPTSQECSETLIGEKFQLAKVCLNAHEPHSVEAGWDVVERIFKTIGVGGLCLSDYVEEIEKGFGLINGQHLLMAKSPKEYIELAEEIIQHPDNYGTIRKQGMAKVLADHTYIKRCEKLLEDLGL